MHQVWRKLELFFSNGIKTETWLLAFLEYIEFWYFSLKGFANSLVLSFSLRLSRFSHNPRNPMNLNCFLIVNSASSTDPGPKYETTFTGNVAGVAGSAIYLNDITPCATVVRYKCSYLTSLFGSTT